MRLTSGRLLCITTFSFFFYSLLAEVKYTRKSLKIRAKLINKGGLDMLCFFSFIYCIFFFYILSSFHFIFCNGCKKSIIIRIKKTWQQVKNKKNKTKQNKGDVNAQLTDHKGDCMRYQADLNAVTRTGLSVDATVC